MPPLHLTPRPKVLWLKVWYTFVAAFLFCHPWHSMLIKKGRHYGKGFALDEPRFTFFAVCNYFADSAGHVQVSLVVWSKHPPSAHCLPAVQQLEQVKVMKRCMWKQNQTHSSDVHVCKPVACINHFPKRSGCSLVCWLRSMRCHQLTCVGVGRGFQDSVSL